MGEVDRVEETESGRKVQPCVIAAIVLLVIGLCFKIFGKFWLAWPATRYTALLYLFLEMAWLPVLVWCGWRKRAGGCRLAVIVLIAGLFLILAPFSDRDMASLRASMLAPLNITTCEVDSMPEGRERYTCEFHPFEAPNLLLVFEGREGGILMKLVERDMLY